MDGILLFNKPILWTSHDAVDFIRRRLDQRRVGHAGTLDPMATGLLVMLLGRSTKLSNEMSGLEKEYAGSMRLGISTDTQDMEGRILREASYEKITREDVLRVFDEMKGIRPQTPPAFSAVHQAGRRLYEMARQGLAVEAPSRQVEVRRLELHDFFPPEVYFSVVCSKGTYIRALCDEAGMKLGTGATLSSLVRTAIGPMRLSAALTEEQVVRLSPEEIEKHLLR
jgi:tRNA pseudouridine55 synthase